MTDADKRSYVSDLVRKCQDGNNDAWHDLIDLITPTIFGLCKRSRLSRDESFDIFGQVCLRLIETIKTVRNPEKISFFVATITRRKIYAFYKKSRLLNFLDDQDVLSLTDDQQADPEKDYEQSRKHEILYEAMGRLPTRDFLLIEMLFFDPDQPTYDEIARKLNMPVSSVGPIRGKALAKLYRMLKHKRKTF